MNAHTIKIIIVTLLLSCSMTIASERAFSLTGEDLSEYCNSSIAVDDKNHQPYNTNSALSTMNQDGICRGYLLGFIDSATFSAATRKDLFVANNICLPDGVNVKQLIKVIVKYLDEHPEDLHQNSFALVMSALGSKFPCASEMDAAIHKINNSYMETREELCKMDPSPVHCSYTCTSIDLSGDKLLCHWPNGKSFTYKRIDN